MKPNIKDPAVQREVFCELLKKDGLDLMSALKRCGIDPDSMVEDADDDANSKKMRHDDNEDDCDYSLDDEDMKIL